MCEVSKDIELGTLYSTKVVLGAIWINDDLWPLSSVTYN